MDRARIEEEKNKLLAQFFTYAESPIKEWLAEYLGEPVSEVYTDFADDADMIGYESNGKYYNAYLVSMEPGQTAFVDADLIKNDEPTKKACSMLFDAVKTVIHPVLNICEPSFKEALSGLYFEFDNDNLAFVLTVVNDLKYKKVSAAENRTKLIEMHNSLVNMYKQYQDNIAKGMVERPVDPYDMNDPRKIPEQLTRVDELIRKAEAVFDAIPDEDIAARDLECARIQSSMPTKNKLYMVVEEADGTDVDRLDASMKRLPTFGNTYEDPDEETFSQTLRREFNTNE
jgi:hypothetical protein